MITRSEYLEWAKNRAFAKIKSDSQVDAATAFVKDLESHPETKNHPKTLTLVIKTALGASVQQVVDFIKGFH